VPPTSDASSAPFLDGEVLDGKYRMGAILGEGAMGLVFEAEHLLLDKKVAIKVLRPELTGDEELRRRFEIEARAAAAVSHPNVVTVSDMGRTARGAVYFVMDRLVGETLADRLERMGRMPLPAAVAIGVEILDALEAAHAVGLVHRDLKLENVFLSGSSGGKERVKVLDFGVAKVGVGALAGSASATRTGVVMGTPEFMAPEQARAERTLDARVDIYALGVMLYRMVSGRHPFLADSAMGMIAALLTETPPDLGELRPELPVAFVALVTSAMARDRDRRPSTAAAFRARLQAACGPAPSEPALRGMAAPSQPAMQVAAEPAARGTASSADLVPLDEHPRTPAPVMLATVDALTPIAQLPPFHQARERPLELDTPRPVVSLAEVRRRRQGRMAPHPDERPSLDLGPVLRRLGTLAGVAVAGWLIWSVGNRVWREVDRRAHPPVAAVAPPPPPPPAPPLSPTVIVQVEVTPATARLALDGAPLDSPRFSIARSSLRHALRASREGYAAATVEFVPDDSKTVQVRLSRLRRPR
jgi:serine/threonine protein kinase